MRFGMRYLTDLSLSADSRAMRRAIGRRSAEVRQARREHDARIRPLLTSALQQLQDLPLDDGLIQSLRIDPGQRTLGLRLLCDDRDGYFDLNLVYKGIRLTPQETSLLCLIAHEEGAEIDEHEIDLLPEDWEGGSIESNARRLMFVHRLSWHTGIQTGREPPVPNACGEDTYRVYRLQPETEFRFGGLELETVRRSDRRITRADDFITIVRDPNRIEGMELLDTL